MNFTVSINVAILNYISSSHWVRPHLQHSIWSHWLSSSGVNSTLVLVVATDENDSTLMYYVNLVIYFWVVADNRLPMDGEIPKMILGDKYLIPHPISLVVFYSFPVSKISCTCLGWPVYHLSCLLHSEENIEAILAPWRKLESRLSHWLDKYIIITW